MVAFSHIWLFEFKIIKIIQFLSRTSYIKVLSRHMWLVATVLSSADKDCFCHSRALYWSVLLESRSLQSVKNDLLGFQKKTL